MNLNDIRKNAYLNINNAENQPDENDIVFEEKKDQIILSKNVQNNTVKKFTFQSISKVVDEIQDSAKWIIAKNNVEFKAVWETNKYTIKSSHNASSAS